MKRRLTVPLLIFLGLAAIGAWAALHAVVEHRAVDEARRHGLALRIDRVTFGLTAVTFEGLHATEATDAPGSPALVLDAADATLSLRGLSPKELVIRKPVLTMARGEASLAVLAAIRDRSSRRAPGGAAEPLVPANAPSTVERIVVEDGVATLSGLPSAGLRLVLRGVAGELTREPSDGPSAEPGSALALRGELVLLVNERQTGGPWSLALRRAKGVDQQIVELKPTAPGTATFRREVGGVRDGRVRLVVQKCRVDELGLPDLAGAPVGSPKATLDLDLDHEVTAASVRGHATIAISRFTMPGAPADAPLRASLAYEGTEAAARIREGAFAFGPFHGTVTGTVDVASQPPKVHLALTSTKTPCETLARTVAEQTLPGVGAALRALGLDDATKGLITGEMGFVAHVDLDAPSLSAPRFDVQPVGGCSVDIPLFPAGR